MRRPSLLLLLCGLPLVAATGCLSSADLSPLGYACSERASCGGGLRCVDGLCTDAPDPIQPLERLNGPTGDQVLAFTEEAARLVARGYRTEGARLLVSTEPEFSRTAVYRLIQPELDDYLFTASATENESAVRNYGYVSEGPVFYAFPMQAEAGVPVYRLSRGAKHMMAIGEAERDLAVTNGWNYEFPVFRAEAP